ncbi:unnamed protein product [Candida verbasci]|uniref:Protein kinase domain-containing protein n=1 Tax=Candida verbasci TaxID=1227364 RepID=A0A9W4TWM6_9ASCO|nr:unnamed protein product [Candida verbasci]
MSEQSTSKEDYQFSFMKETSSSMQKKQINPFNNGNLNSIPKLPSSSTTKKRLNYSRQLSSRRRILSNSNSIPPSKLTTNFNTEPRRILSNSSVKSNTSSFSISPSKRITSLNLDPSPSKHKTNMTQPHSNVFDRLCNEPSPSKHKRNITQPITNPNINYDSRHPESSPSKPKRNITQPSVGVFDRLYSKPTNINLPSPTKKDTRKIENVAPEIMIGAPYSEKIDIWSLGCVLAELYMGYPLLSGKNELEQLGLIMEIFGMPNSSMIVKMRMKLTQEVKKNIEMNEKQTKKTLLYKIFDMNGKLNISLLNYYYNQSSNNVKKQFKCNSKNLDIVMGCNDTEFIKFLKKCFIWDPAQRYNVDQLIDVL